MLTIDPWKTKNGAQLNFTKHSHRYLAPVQYLFNRRFDLRSLLTRLACVASRPSPGPPTRIRAAAPTC